MIVAEAARADLRVLVRPTTCPDIAAGRASFHDEVRRLIAGTGEACIVTLHRQRGTAREEVLAGHCRECTDGCTWRIARATHAFATGDVEVRVRGQHGTRDRRDATRVWTAQEAAALDAEVHPLEPATAASVRDALRKRGLAPQCTPQQLRNYVKNRNATLHRVSPAPSLTVAELRSIVDTWSSAQSPSLGAAAVDELVLLGQPVVSATQVCIPWTTHGMSEK